ncbi:MAG: CHAT domain-containing protein, partial [Deltaproteobacteria bacterium]|nr:CHAT domain-containing protein [Deltaproteobacteria bacterium]
WVVRKNKVKPLELPVGRGEVSDLVSNIRSEISTPSFSPSISLLHQAYRKLLASVAPYLAHNIILAPHDQLYLLPFEALVVNKAGPYYVVDSHFVSYYSSGSALVLNRRYQEKKPSPSKPLFAVADPVFGPKDSRYRGGLQLAKAERGALARRVWMSNEMGSLVQEKKQEKLVFNRLPNTALEVKGIASLYGISEKSTDINIGFSATEKVVKQADHTKYRFEHYATHGVVRGDVPGIKEPALVFALPNPEDPELDEGFWTMSEIFGMKSNAEMVVLSACKTALGEEVPGEGLIGLTRAFMYAGAPTVVASLWSVNDPATAFLMKSFYRYLRKGIDKSRALTLAKRETMRRFHNPYYWAPFIMEGEGR